MGNHEDDELCFNGIDADSGAYLFEPMHASELADLAMGRTFDDVDSGREADHRAELERRHAARDDGAPHLGVKEGIDPDLLEQAGWGVIFAAVEPGSEAAREQDAIREALSPLLELRRRQATQDDERFYAEYRGASGYRAKEGKVGFLSRHGAGPGPADPAVVPYYLLIVGPPSEIPFKVQYQLDVQYAVGRIHFETVEDYAAYARTVVAAETGEISAARELAFVGVANRDDRATKLSRAQLVEPLAERSAAKFPDWTITRHFDEQAHKAAVAGMLGGPQTPALMFTASHGVGFKLGDKRQLGHQGALLMQDWPGPRRWRKPLDERLYLSADDLRSDAGLGGMIAFTFACYGAGTPQYDEFSKRSKSARKQLAAEPFVSNLHRRMLCHPKGGALATIGHIDRAWGCSFSWATGEDARQTAQLAAFESALSVLMQGKRVGAAVEYFNERYAELASDLTVTLEAYDEDPEGVDPAKLVEMWTSNNDARGYAVIGDPAVRLPLAQPGATSKREVIVVSTSEPAPAPAPEPGPEPTSSSPAAAETDALVERVRAALADARTLAQTLESLLAELERRGQDE